SAAASHAITPRSSTPTSGWQTRSPPVGRRRALSTCCATVLPAAANDRITVPLRTFHRLSTSPHDLLLLPHPLDPMKLSLSRETFLARLGIAVRGVSTRSSIQTLSGVMLRPDQGALELQATDMDMGVRVKVDAEVEGEQAIVLPGRLLLDVVRS